MFNVFYDRNTYFSISLKINVSIFVYSIFVYFFEYTIFVYSKYLYTLYTVLITIKV